MASKPPAKEHDLAAFKMRFPAVPEEYAELMRDASEIELACGSHYLRIWHPETCVEMDEAYEISQRLPGSIPIGDDGGGRVLLYFNGTRGGGLYRVGYGDLEPEETVWVAASLKDLLSDRMGIENL